MYVIKTFLIDRKVNKEHFVETSCRKCAPKSIFLILANPKQPLHARNFLKRCFHYQIVLKKLTLIFLSYPVPFDGLSFGKK